MRLCIVGPKESRESLLVKNIAEERGHECKRINMMDVYFEVVDTEFRAKHRRFDLMDFDIFLFRAMKKHFKEAMLLAEYLQAHGKTVVDQGLATDRLISIADKFMLSQNNVPQIDQVLTYSLKAARDILMEIEHPIVIKPLNPEKKQKAHVSDDWTDSYDLARTNKDKTFLFLKRINTHEYFRYYVIGDTVVGAIKKTIDDKEQKLHYSFKFKSTKAAIDKRFTDLALKAATSLHYEIVAIDILEFEDKLYVLNTKRAPQFTKFQKLTKVNYSEKLLEYLESKA
jgi:glutathione synthase/RimK-type ligase-like ATP-grasp enzyme